MSEAPRPSASRPRPGQLVAEAVSPVGGTTRDAVVTIEDRQPARLEVPGARLHVPAGIVTPGTEIRLAVSPVGQSGFPADEHPDREPLSEVFTVSSSTPQRLQGRIDLVIDLPPGPSSGGTVGRAFWSSYFGHWRVHDAEVPQDQDVFVQSMHSLASSTSSFMTSPTRIGQTRYELSELELPRTATVVRATIREDRPTVLSVPGATLRIGANTQAPGTLLELASQPISTSDYPAGKARGTPLSPMITLRSAPSGLDRPIALEFDVPADAARPRVTYRTRAERLGCLVDGPQRWDGAVSYASRLDDDGTFRLRWLPKWYSFVLVDEP